MSTVKPALALVEIAHGEHKYWAAMDAGKAAGSASLRILTARSLLARYIGDPVRKVVGPVTVRNVERKEARRMKSKEPGAREVRSIWWCFEQCTAPRAFAASSEDA